MSIKSISTFGCFIFLAFFSCSILAKKTNKTTPPYPLVKFETSVGPMTIELYPAEAPITVKNFLRYIDEGFYEGTIFHRVVSNFVIQGGGMMWDFTKKPTHEPIENEADNGLINDMAFLSMARSSKPDSATSQFFINIKHNESLDKNKENAGYAVFGKVIEGFEVVKKIEREPRGLYRAHPEAPNYPVIVEKAYRVTPPTEPAENK